MAGSVHNVLFICAHNSSQSIIAESVMNALGGGRFRAYSAGSAPSGRVHPLALSTLAANGYPTTGLRSKPVAEFLGSRAPELDFVITLDPGMGAVSPTLPKAKAVAHWQVSDPEANDVDGAERRAAFQGTLGVLRRRIQQVTGLPFESVDERALGGALREIGTLS